MSSSTTMNDSDSEDEYGFKEFFETMAKRPLHRVITPELIAEQPDDEIEVTIFDIAWAAKSSDRLQLLARLPEGYSVVYATMALEAEVSNGGFNQFFYNPTRVFYDLAVAGYKRLELPEIVALVEKANGMYSDEGRGWKKAKLLLSGTLAGFFKSYEHSSLGSLDEQMWSAKDRISGQRIRFIQDNPQLFVGDFHHLYENSQAT